MKLKSIKNKRKEIWRLDEVAIKFKRYKTPVRITVESSNGEIVQWHGATKKDAEKLYKLRWDDLEIDNEILKLLSEIIELQPK